MRAILSSLFLSGLAGCAAGGDALANVEQASDTGAGESDDGGDVDTAGSDSDAFVAGNFSLAAALSIADGLPVLDSVQVNFVLADAGGDRWDCAVLAPDDLALADPAPAGQYLWLSLTVPGDDGCSLDDLVLPARLGIGIGPMDPEVRAQLGRIDKDSEAASLWGAYASADDGLPYAFGYAEGADGVNADSAPPDGEYRLEPLLVELLPAAE